MTRDNLRVVGGAGQQERRRGGRPDAQTTLELEARILEAASRVFRQDGFSGASMEQIAVAAGTGKQTIYRRYSSKEELFAAVVMEVCSVFLEAAKPASVDVSDPLSALRDASQSALELICREDVVGIYRLLIGESARFTGLVQQVVKTVDEPFHAGLLSLLNAAEDAGQIQSGSGHIMTAWALSGLSTGWTLQHFLLGGDELKDPGKRTAFFERAWQIFLNGVCGSRALGVKQSQ